MTLIPADEFLADDEVECVDCGCAILKDPERRDFTGRVVEPRCDTCEEHHYGLCGSDCPILGCKNARSS